ncbi:alpha/beta hydrolase [Actinoplanes sp. DH11]|uniref:alpha/beta hydrolase n=1 Tax=Actinoplanes sp. DH11 TaxID=2857011 RepID=UPI001E296961|nr:alpha/beta hydrolase [Actinoplanes sp. DH11]
MTALHSLLRVTDPGRWRSAALAWRRWSALAGALSTEFGALAARIRASWSGRAGSAAVAALGDARHRIALFRVFCWRADQALSEFAAALARARQLLDRARSRAAGAGLVIDDAGTVHGRSSELPRVAADLSAALGLAAAADAEAADRLDALCATAAGQVGAPGGIGTPGATGGAPGWIGTPGATGGAPGATGALGPAAGPGPDCAAGPAEVRRWWAALTPVQRDWLLATAPATLAARAGIPAADRDVANRMLLDDRRLPGERPVAGLAELGARLDDEAGLRPYLLSLDVSNDGRAVVALGDPDRARHVLTHVPGMTSDLDSAGGELTRAERVAVRAGELAPDRAVSAVLWLDYDAPDFVHEAFSDRQARDGAEGLRRFQESLRVTHEGPAAHQTVLGHSYGSLVVGAAAAGPFAADEVVFVGSPGVGVDAAAGLAVPPDHVWSTTSRTDVIQYAAVSPRGLPGDLALAGVPLIGPALAFGTPERDLWFGRNPSDTGFGAQVFASQADAGHLGYWDPGRPALDALARITLDQAPVTRR